MDWSNLDAIMVVMAETSASQFHRGQGTGSCTLPQGPGGANASLGCAIFSENPSSSDVANWGRWAHEIGHAFQENPTPAHPSNYNNAFELMDSNLPGQTGVFSKQAGKAFTGWMPGDHYEDIVPDLSGSAPAWAPTGAAVGGGLVNLKAMEYDPALAPNLQAARVYITQNLYYLVSARRRVLGDDLNDGNSPAGIPDEGLLVERVVEGGNTSLNDCAGQPTSCPRWVEVKGPGGNGNRLWTAARDNDDRYLGDGVVMSFKEIDPDNWQIRVTYRDAAQPDVAVSPWRSPPSNTWESTDIWVDSPVNGYGTYRYGTQTSLSGDSVPRGNGDDPAVSQRNRVYTRVRNLGTQAASNVVVHLDRTDPEGRGINGSNGFTGLGTVTQADFPGLANIPAGEYTDVYVEYTPGFTPTAQQIAEGRFAFHTCVRVRVDTVAGETVRGNQDGNGEQENIDTFQATNPSTPGAPQYDSVIHLRNDDPVKAKAFSLSYQSTLPHSWKVLVNGGDQNVLLAGGEERDFPVEIVPPGRGTAPALGKAYFVDVQADYQHDLVNLALPPSLRLHQEFKPLGGVRVEARVMTPTKIDCRAARTGRRAVLVKGLLDGAAPTPQAVFIQGTDREGNPIAETGRVVTTTVDGELRGQLRSSRERTPDGVICLFAGTRKLASAGAGPVPIG